MGAAILQAWEQRSSWLYLLPQLSSQLSSSCHLSYPARSLTVPFTALLIMAVVAAPLVQLLVGWVA